MSKYYFILVCLICLTSFQFDGPRYTNTDFEEQLKQYQILIEKSLVYRAKFLRMADELSQKPDEAISPEILEEIKSNIKATLLLKDQLYKIAEKYENAFENYNSSPLPAPKNRSRDKLGFNEFCLSLSAALTLYDNYLLSVAIFEKDKRFRRLLNGEDMGFDIESGELKDVVWDATSFSQQKRIKKGIKLYKSTISIADTIGNDSAGYLQALIKSSPSFYYLDSIGYKEMSINRLKLIGHITRDAFKKIGVKSFDKISKSFGNSVGIVESRKGMLYAKPKIVANFRALLQPMDILLEKTPFRLTDKLIPGYFGHVAIWVGNKQELIELGMWNHKVIKPYHDQISPEVDSLHPRNVIEALRAGVEINSLEHFMNIDDFVILRPVFPKGKKDLKRAMLLAFRQIGKDYDFNFDVNTTDKIVCSEIAYVCYPFIKWPTERSMGRFTISPDNVANLSLAEKEIQLKLLYIDGKPVEQDKMLVTMEQLLSEK